MAELITLTANWTTGKVSSGMISRQYDNNRYCIKFTGIPDDGGENLIYYLLIYMKTEEGAAPVILAPVQLASDEWIISNYFTQIVQQVKFQLCVQNEAGTFEAHSPIFDGSIRDSLDHDGEDIDIDTSELFDYYRAYVEERVNELIVAAGAVQIDTSLSVAGAAAEAKAVGDALSNTNERLEVLESGGTGGTGIPSNVRQAIYALFEHGAYKDADMSEEKAVVYAWANAPTAITLDKSTITLGNAGTSQITATTTPTGAVVTWSTSNSAVATVSNSGLVTAVGNGSCTITATSGDVSATCAVTVSGMLSMFSVTNNLTNCTNSNSATAVTENDSYSATLTADSGYALRNVTVTMGGTDITSTAYSNGSISIATVTGNVVITATAIVPPAWEDGVPYTFTWTDDKYITGSGAAANFSGLSVSNYAGCDGVSSVTVENHTGQTIQYTGWYDSSKTFISKMNTVLNNQTGTMTPPENAAFFRITVKTDGKSGLTVTPTA